MLSRVNTMSDSMWFLHTTASILHRGDSNLDEYRPLIEREHGASVVEENGHLYNIFPIGSSLVALPFVGVLDLAGNLFYGLQFHRYLSDTWGRQPQQAVASAIVATTAVVLLLIGIECGLSVMQAMILGCVFAFCSPAWSTASRVLWQHGPSMLMLSLALWLFLLGKRHRLAVVLAGLPLALSWIVRPTNAISCAVFVALIFWYYRRSFPVFCLILFCSIGTYMLYSWSIYQHVTPPYYAATRLGTNAAFWEAFIANLVSPARGVFVWSPVFILSFLGVQRKYWQGRFPLLPYALMLIIVLHLVAISSFGCWWGGHTIGPRLMSDMSLFLTVLLIPVIKRVFEYPGKRRAFAYAFAFLCILSASIHGIAANNYGAPQWNERIDKQDLGCIWDWSDLQFLRREKN